jgi:HK97 gp10 family phage protein
MQVNVTISKADEMKWRRAMRKIITHGGVHGVRVGILDGSTNDDGEVIAQYAAYNEFGTSRIPARPFMRYTLAKQLRAWSNIFSSITRGNWLKDEHTVARAFTALGRRAQDDVKATILSNMPPPNNPEYAESKKKKNGGYSGTLFKTGAMLQAIHFMLVDKKGDMTK